MFIWNDSEILRYMGFRHGTKPGAAVLSVIDECKQILENAAEYKSIHKIFSVEFMGSDMLKFPFAEFKSKGLSKNLCGCDSCVLFAATLGPGTDRMIRRALVEQVSRAHALQAVSASMLESFIDQDMMKLSGELPDGAYLRPRFSPGYGDLPLSVQRCFFDVLPLSSVLGMTLRESMIISPSKSVTAFAGIFEPDKK